MSRYVYRITRHDPADRDVHGRYLGSEDSTGEPGPNETAYLQAVAAFAADAAVDRLTIREPSATGFNRLGTTPATADHGLTGIFPADLSGYHDGATVPLDTGLELVRAMLRETGAWCRLEVEDTFAVHVGWDRYLYVATTVPSSPALSRTRALGLFPERLDASPYHFNDECDVRQRPADDTFWARLKWFVATGRAAILEEGFIQNASGWHRLTEDTIDGVRQHLAPRALLTVWPDLSTDITAVMAGLPDEGLVEVVWEDRTGRITGVIADETELPELVEELTDARAAAVLPWDGDERTALFTAVMPDDDGVLRARWRTEPTPGDRAWARLQTLRAGRTHTAEVIQATGDGDVLLDLGGVSAVIEAPHGAGLAETLRPGRSVAVEVCDIDMVRERVTVRPSHADREQDPAQ